jgi:hypothetical protein
MHIPSEDGIALELNIENQKDSGVVLRSYNFYVSSGECIKIPKRLIYPGGNDSIHFGGSLLLRGCKGCILFQMTSEKSTVITGKDLYFIAAWHVNPWGRRRMHLELIESGSDTVQWWSDRLVCHYRRFVKHQMRKADTPVKHHWVTTDGEARFVLSAEMTRTNHACMHIRLERLDANEKLTKSPLFVTTHDFGTVDWHRSETMPTEKRRQR